MEQIWRHGRQGIKVFIAAFAVLALTAMLGAHSAHAATPITTDHEVVINMAGTPALDVTDSFKPPVPHSGTDAIGTSDGVVTRVDTTHWGTTTQPSIEGLAVEPKYQRPAEWSTTWTDPRTASIPKIGEYFWVACPDLTQQRVTTRQDASFVAALRWLNLRI